MSDDKMLSHHGVKYDPRGNYPNDTLKLLMERASCRNFSDKPVPQDIMEYILESGIHAATGGNLQPFSIIQIENAGTRAKLAEMCYQKFMAKAPVHLLFCIDWHRLERWAELEVAPFSARSAFRHFWISFQDTIICAQNICTAIDALGLGSVYIGTIFEFVPQVRKMFKLPRGVLPVVLLCFGYPKSKPQPRKKLPLKAIVHSEHYHELDAEELKRLYSEKYPDMKVTITDRKLKTIRKVCTTVHGKQFADKCLKKIESTGFINPVQRYFGLHYRADQMPDMNKIFMDWIGDCGFHWFKEVQPENSGPS